MPLQFLRNMRLDLLLGMALLLSACSAPIPDAGEKKSNQSLSKAACDAWGEKVGQAYKGITRCTQGGTLDGLQQGTRVTLTIEDHGPFEVASRWAPLT